MKKPYNGIGKKIHPSPPPSSPCDLLSVLPAAILTLAAALSLEEEEVLAYLLFGAIAEQDKIAGKKNSNHHPPELGCGCFGCYKSFWARWDASPNRHLIHHILDAVEESVEPLAVPSDRRCRRRFNPHKDFKEEFFAAAEDKGSATEEDGKVEEFEEFEEFEEEDYSDIEEAEKEEEAAEAMAGVSSLGTVRRFFSFIGERVWGVWNQ